MSFINRFMQSAIVHPSRSPMATLKNGAGYRVSAVPAIIMAQLFGIASVTLMLVWTIRFQGGLSFNPSEKERFFNLHKVLTLFGMIYCGGQAIIAFKAVPGAKKVKKFVHSFLHLVALMLTAVGVYAVFKFMNDTHSANMYTLHSWIGMATICLYALQWLLGFITFCFPGAAMSTRASMVPWHALFGVVIFAMAICTAETGLVERFIFAHLTHGSQAIIVNFAGLAILLFGIAVVLSVILD